MSVPFQFKQIFREIFDFAGTLNKMSLEELHTFNAYVPRPFSKVVFDKYSPMCPLNVDNFMGFVAAGQLETGDKFDEIAWGYIENYAKHNLFNGEDLIPLKNARVALDFVVKSTIKEPELTEMWKQNVTSDGERVSPRELAAFLKQAVTVKKIGLLELLRGCQYRGKGGKKAPPKVEPPEGPSSPKSEPPPPQAAPPTLSVDPNLSTTSASLPSSPMASSPMGSPNGLAFQASPPASPKAKDESGQAPLQPSPPAPAPVLPPPQPATPSAPVQTTKAPPPPPSPPTKSAPPAATSAASTSAFPAASGPEASVSQPALAEGNVEAKPKTISFAEAQPTQLQPPERPPQPFMPVHSRSGKTQSVVMIDDLEVAAASSSGAALAGSFAGRPGSFSGPSSQLVQSLRAPSPPGTHDVGVSANLGGETTRLPPEVAELAASMDRKREALRRELDSELEALASNNEAIQVLKARLEVLRARNTVPIGGEAQLLPAQDDIEQLHVRMENWLESLRAKQQLVRQEVLRLRDTERFETGRLTLAGADGALERSSTREVLLQRQGDQYAEAATRLYPDELPTPAAGFRPASFHSPHEFIPATGLPGLDELRLSSALRVTRFNEELDERQRQLREKEKALARLRKLQQQEEALAREVELEEKQKRLQAEGELQAHQSVLSDIRRARSGGLAVSPSAGTSPEPPAVAPAQVPRPASLHLLSGAALSHKSSTVGVGSTPTASRSDHASWPSKTEGSQSRLTQPQSLPKPGSTREKLSADQAARLLGANAGGRLYR